MPTQVAAAGTAGTPLVRAAWWLWPAVMVLAVLGLVGADAGTGRPVAAAPAGTAGRAEHVLVVGIAGLRWDDVTATGSPTLWRLATHGAVGTLTDRSTQALTCPDDGWLTLGAGNRAQRGPRRTVTGRCPPIDVNIDDAAGYLAATLPDQRDVVARNQLLPTGARPGTLAEAVPCTTAVGGGAAIAGTRPVGRLDRYQDRLPAQPGGLLADCPVTLVDAGTIAGSGPGRAATVRAADRILARVVAAQPPHTAVLVAGLADTEAPARLHVAVAAGPGFGTGWLSSTTTDRTGYVQLIDVAPTVLAALGRPRPAAISGQPWTWTARTGPLGTARADLMDADRLSVATAADAGGFVAALVLAQLALYLAATLMLVQRRRQADGVVSRWSRWTGRAPAEVAVSAVVLMIPAMLLTSLVPWWRAGRPGLALAGTVLAIVAALTAVVQLGPWRRYRFGRFVATALVAAGVIGVDALTGAHLELDNVVGYAAVTGDRYTGLGMLGLGAFLAAMLMLAGAVATRLPRRFRPLVVALIGAMAVVIVGSPFVGGDPGGAIGVTAGVSIAAVIATGGWLTVSRLGWAVVAGLAVAGGFALLDLLHPIGQRGHLGRFLTNLVGATPGPAMTRVAEANMVATTQSALTLLVLAGGLFGLLVLLRPVGGLRRVYGLFPALRGALVGSVVAGLLAGLLDGAGLIVLGAASTVALPLTILCCRYVQLEQPGQPVRPDLPDLPDPVPAATPVGATAPPDPRPAVTVKSRGSRTDDQTHLRHRGRRLLSG